MCVSICPASEAGMHEVSFSKALLQVAAHNFTWVDTRHGQFLGGTCQIEIWPFIPINHFCHSQAEVTDVQWEADGAVAVYATAAVPSKADVHVKVDWAHRFDLMQQHTGLATFFSCDDDLHTPMRPIPAKHLYMSK